MKKSRSDKGTRKERIYCCPFCEKPNLANLKIHLKSCTSPKNKSYDKSYVKSKMGRTEGRKWTQEQKDSHRKVMQQAVRNNPDSYRGRFFRGYNPFIHEGVSYDSEWEFKVKRYFDSVKLTYIRLTNGFPYVHKGISRTYFPDFYLPNLNAYVEVKGLATTRDLSKWRAFKHKLIVIPGMVVRHIVKGGGFDFKAAANHSSQFIIGTVPYTKRGLLKLKVSQFDGLSLRPKQTEKEKRENRSAAQKKAWGTPERLAQREQARLRNLEKRKLLDKRYTGSSSSQLGSFWLTDGSTNLKWRESKGKIPKGFKRGRTL